MPQLYVQLPDKKGDLWHTVESYQDVETAGSAKGASSQTFDRSYRLGCGSTQQARADRLAEAEGPPWTNRHVHKGCFKTAADPQEK